MTVLYENNRFLFVTFYKLLWFYAEKRDIYLAFKAMNMSETGYLTEEEFMDVYSVVQLRWKVVIITC